MEETWRRINLTSPSPSARAPFDNGVQNNSMVISSSTAVDSTSFHCIFHPETMQNQQYSQLFTTNRPIIIKPNQGLANITSSYFGTGKKKRLEECEHSNSGDTRHMRMMIKNRDSAAKCRKRKKAYTDWLEFEAQRLKEENARLKIQVIIQQQQQRRYSSMVPASEQPKKHYLRRSSSAAF